MESLTRVPESRSINPSRGVNNQRREELVVRLWGGGGEVSEMSMEARLLLLTLEEAFCLMSPWGFKKEKCNDFPQNKILFFSTLAKAI